MPVARLLASTASTLGLMAAVATQEAPASAQHLDQPTARAWPVRRGWDARMEREYGQFVQTIGRAFAAGRCHTLWGCLNSEANPLPLPHERLLRLRADCADVPYTLRAWFSLRHGLPFVMHMGRRGMGGAGGDATLEVPAGTRTWREFETPRGLFSSIASDVHSGTFRHRSSDEVSDTYPVAVNRRAIHPGTMYNDPNGHILVVYEVRPDGEVLLFDGHPDNSVSHKRFDDRLATGTERNSGGFVNFRPLVLRRGRVVPLRNAELRDFDPHAQYATERQTVAGIAVGFHAWVNAQLATAEYRASRTASATAAVRTHRHTRREARARFRRRVTD